MEKPISYKTLFALRADELVSTMLSEFDELSNNYYAYQNNYLESIVSKLNAEGPPNDEDYFPAIQLEERLWTLTCKVKAQAKQLTLFHPIGEEIIKYYHERLGIHTEYIEILENHWEASKSDKTMLSYGEIHGDHQRRKIEAGFSYEDIYEQITQYISILRREIAEM
jgi:hypothetical protein